MKKVLFTATVDSHILHFHLPYLEYFKNNNYEVHVATNTDKPILYCDKKHKIDINRSPYSLKNVKAIFQLKKIINAEKYDIIHCHTPMGSVVTRFSSMKTRKKNKTRIIYTAHGFHFYKGAPLKNWLLFYPIEKLLANYTDDIITINKEDYELAKEKFNTNVHYVHGVGLNKNKFDIVMKKSEKTRLKKSLGLKDTDFIISYVARLDKNKNQKFLIDVMDKILKKNKNIHLLFIGNDELNGYYQRIVKNKKIQDNIHFLGYRSDIPKLLRITDLAVSSSKREGLPVNIMEAMYCKVPIVALKNRGIDDLIIGDNRRKLLVSNEEEMVEKIDCLISNNIKTIDYSNINSYLIDNVLQEVQKIYDIENDLK